MANLVKFWHNTKANYDLLAVKDPATVYFCSDTRQIFRGTSNYSDAVRVVDTLPEVPGEGVLYIIRSGENAGGWIDFGSGVTKVIEKYALVGGLKNADTTTSGLMTPEQVGNLNLLLEGRDSTNAAIEELKSVKADKVVGAVSGNFATFESNGNLADSGKNSLNFTVALTTTEDGINAKKYIFTQGGVEIGSIDIPKDMVISSGTVEDIAEGTVIQGGSYLPAGKYIVLTVANSTSDKIYIPVKDLCDVYTGGAGITIDSSNKISLKAVTGNGLVVDENGLHLNLATQDAAGALSAVDKTKIDRMEAIYRTNKYAVVGLDEGCLVDLKDNEIRVMFPADYKFKLQNSGEGANPNSYYYGVKTFVPDDTVWVGNGLLRDGSDFEGELFEERVARGFAGYDNGRKYTITWFVAAVTNDGGTTWSYYGANSSERKIGNWQMVKAYSDAEHTKLIYSNMARICLENEESWLKPVDQFNTIFSVDTSNGLTLVSGKLGFDSSFVKVDDANIAVTRHTGESTTLNIALEDIYEAIVWNEL